MKFLNIDPKQFIFADEAVAETGNEHLDGFERGIQAMGYHARAALSLVADIALSESGADVIANHSSPPMMKGKLP